MKNDPYQLESLHRKVDPSVLAQLSARVSTLLACRAATCRE
jgi:hypothetical protein